jgi:hypothetical protein
VSPHRCRLVEVRPISLIECKNVRRLLNNTFSSHSGLDPESRKHLITLDTGLPDFSRAGLRRYDDIGGYVGFGKVLVSG